MKQILLFFLLITFYFRLDAQRELSPEESVSLREICKSYLLEKENAKVAPEYDYKKLREVATDSMALLVKKTAEFFQLLDQKVIFLPQEVTGLINTDTAFGCQVSLEDYPGYWLDLKLVEGTYKVSGTNGKAPKPAFFAHWDHLADSVRGEKAEVEKIKQSVLNFFEGLFNYYDQQDLQLLKTAVSEPHLEIIQLRKSRDSLLERSFRKYVVEEMDYVNIVGDSADCHVRVKQHGGSTMKLIRIKDQWRVMGENSSLATPEEVEKARVRLEETRQKVKLDKLLHEEFNPALIKYLTEGDPGDLSPLCEAHFFDFLQKFRNKFGAFDPTYLKVYGLRSGGFINSDIQVAGDSAEMRMVSNSLHFVRSGGDWKACGIDSLFGNSLSDRHLEKQFEEMKQMFRLRYSFFNSLPEDASFIVQPESEKERNARKEQKIWHNLDEIDSPAQFPGGVDALFEFMERKLKRPAQNPPGEGYVYLSFVVKMSGSLSELKVVQSLGKEWDAEALRLLQSMPKWVPATHKQENVNSRYVLPVRFK